jgi:hypothetical protein
MGPSKQLVETREEAACSGNELQDYYSCLPEKLLKDFMF